MLQNSAILIEDWSALAPNPIVTVRCYTFNHADFISETIEGFLMQETSFPFEIFIHDDASTDGTAEIIRRYQSENPQLLRVILQSENQWSQGKRPSHLFHKFARGKYVATCEGDDYWTDPHKLQKQVDILESHPDFSICCHGVTYQFDDGTPNHYQGPPIPKKYKYDLRDLCKSNFIVNCSNVFRNNLFSEKPALLQNLAMGDWPLHILNAEHGKIWYIDENMAVYRLHLSGYWTSMDPIIRNLGIMDAIHKMNSYLDHKYEYEFTLALFTYWLDISVHYAKQGNPKKAREYFLKCLNHLGYKDQTSIIDLLRAYMWAYFPTVANYLRKQKNLLFEKSK